MTDDVMILVDFADEEGTLRTVADDDEKKLAELDEKSRKVVEKTLSAIGWISDQAKELVGKGTDRPDQVELEFGIKLTTKAGVIVLQGEGEFHIKAKIIWKHGDE